MTFCDPVGDLVHQGEVKVMAFQFELQVGGLGDITKVAVNDLAISYPSASGLDLPDELATVFAPELDAAGLGLAVFDDGTDHAQQALAVFPGKENFESQVGDLALAVAEQVLRLAVDFNQGTIFLVKDEEGVVGILYQLSIAVVMALEFLFLPLAELFTLSPSSFAVPRPAYVFVSPRVKP